MDTPEMQPCTEVGSRGYEGTGQLPAVDRGSAEGDTTPQPPWPLPRSGSRAYPLPFPQSTLPHSMVAPHVLKTPWSLPMAVWVRVVADSGKISDVVVS